MSEPAIRVDGISKQYRLGGRKERYHTLRDSLARAWKAPVRRILRGGSAKPNFWALKDVSFEVQPGEALGIIGRNGAGKSTLLKILSRITRPTEGRVDLWGRVGSLLEVGTGFHPELTGRENIYLNGAVLGMSRVEIKAKFDEIVAFAEVEQFLDTPVKFYSSGMYVRLAFAVAAHLDPEILLVDEVLAVGDTAFQKKCLGKMGEATSGGRTVLFVSHNMGAIAQLCPRAMLVETGSIVADGPSTEIISKYLRTDSSTKALAHWNEGISNPGVVELKILEVSLLNSAGEVAAHTGAQQPLYLNIRYVVTADLRNVRVGFRLLAEDGTSILEAYDIDDQDHPNTTPPGNYLLACRLPGELLTKGDYVISVNAGIPGLKNLALLERVLAFSVDYYVPGTAPSSTRGRRLGVLSPTLVQWKTTRC